MAAIQRSGAVSPIVLPEIDFLTDLLQHTFVTWTILTDLSLSVCLDLASEAVEVYIPDGRHSLNDGNMRITDAMTDDTQALACGTANYSY